MGEIPKIILD